MYCVNYKKNLCVITYEPLHSVLAEIMKYTRALALNSLTLKTVSISGTSLVVAQLSEKQNKPTLTATDAIFVRTHVTRRRNARQTFHIKYA